MNMVTHWLMHQKETKNDGGPDVRSKAVSRKPAVVDGGSSVDSDGPVVRDASEGEEQ